MTTIDVPAAIDPVERPEGSPADAETLASTRPAEAAIANSRAVRWDSIRMVTPWWMS